MFRSTITEREHWAVRQFKQVSNVMIYRVLSFQELLELRLFARLPVSIRRLTAISMRPFRSWLSGVQFVRQRLGLFQIARIEAFGEPAVNRNKQFARLLHLALVTPEACVAAL
jgi:hypothetical protein